MIPQFKNILQKKNVMQNSFIKFVYIYIYICVWGVDMFLHDFVSGFWFMLRENNACAVNVPGWKMRLTKVILYR